MVPSNRQLQSADCCFLQEASPPLHGATQGESPLIDESSLGYIIGRDIVRPLIDLIISVTSFVNDFFSVHFQFPAAFAERIDDELVHNHPSEVVACRRIYEPERYLPAIENEDLRSVLEKHLGLFQKVMEELCAQSTLSAEIRCEKVQVLVTRFPYEVPLTAGQVERLAFFNAFSEAEEIARSMCPRSPVPPSPPINEITYEELLFEEQEALSSDSFRQFLKSIGEIFDRWSSPEIYIAYAWPTKENEEREGKVQGFLKQLERDLRDLGMRPKLDVKHCGKGESIYEYINGGIERADTVLLFGTESLVSKHMYLNGVPLINTELNLIFDKMVKKKQKRDFSPPPLLPAILTGNIDSALPKNFRGHVNTIFLPQKGYLEGIKRFTYTFYAAQKKGVTLDQFEEHVSEKLKDFPDIARVLETYKVKRDDPAQLKTEKVKKAITTQYPLPLPPPPVDFTGRSDQLGILHSALRNGGHVAIAGYGGMGKTTLSLKYAKMHEEEYDFICYIRAKTIERDLLKLADFLGVAKVKSSERIELLQQELRKLKTPFLLVCDGIDEKAEFNKIEESVLGFAKTILLTTTRPNIAKNLGFKVIQLDAFTSSEACSYLQKVTGRDSTENAGKITEELGNIPLAIKHAGRYILNTNITYASYLDLYKDIGFKLFEASTLSLTEKEKTVLTTWRISLERIVQVEKLPVAKDLLYSLSFLGRAPIPLSLIEAWQESRNKEVFNAQFFDSIAGFFGFKQKKLNKNIDKVELFRAIQILLDYSLLESSGPNQYQLHSLVQKVGIYQLSKEEKEDFFFEMVRLVDQFFKNKIFFETRRFMDFIFKEKNPANIGDRSTLADSIPHAEALLTQNHCRPINTDNLEIFENLSNRIYYYYYYTLEYNKSLIIALNLLNMQKELGISKPTSIANSLGNVGSALFMMWQHEKALDYHKRALAVFTEAFGSEQHLSVTSTLRQIGNVLYAQGQHNEALDHYKKALAIFTEAFGSEQHFSIAMTLNQIGNVLYAQGQHNEALDHYKRALTIFTEAFGSEQHPLVATTLYGIGSLLYAQGLHNKALDHYKRALAIFTEAFGSEQHFSIATTLNQIGNVLCAQGQHNEALDHYKRASPILRKAFDSEQRPSLATTLYGFGSLLDARGLHNVALDFYKSAFAIETEKTQLQPAEAGGLI